MGLGKDVAEENAHYQLGEEGEEQEEKGEGQGQGEKGQGQGEEGVPVVSGLSADLHKEGKEVLEREDSCSEAEKEVLLELVEKGYKEEGQAHVTHTGSTEYLEEGTRDKGRGEEGADFPGENGTEKMEGISYELVEHGGKAADTGNGIQIREQIGVQLGRGSNEVVQVTPDIIIESWSDNETPVLV